MTRIFEFLLFTVVVATSQIIDLSPYDFEELILSNPYTAVLFYDDSYASQEYINEWMVSGSLMQDINSIVLARVVLSNYIYFLLINLCT